MGKVSSRITILERVGFNLVRDLVGRIPCEMALMGKGVWENCLTLRITEYKAQVWYILMCRKLSKSGRRPETKKLLTEFKKEVS